MQAAIYKGVGTPLVLEKQAVPGAGAGELVLKVRACGICGSDIHAAETGFVEPGQVMGHEFCGEITEIGEGLDGWQIGDNVLGVPAWYCGECDNCNAGDHLHCLNLKNFGFDKECQGAYAEYVRIKAGCAIKVPEGLSDQHAVLYEPLSVALSSFNRAGVTTSDNILIVGGGPIGLCIALLAKKFGVNYIGLSERQPERLLRASSCGANVPINAMEHADPVAQFRAVTGKEPTVIFECVGLPGILQQIIGFAPPKARIMVSGTGMQPEEITVVEAAVKHLDFSFTFGYDVEEITYILEALALGQIDPSPLLSSEVSLDELPAMFEKLKQPNDECKVVLTV